MGSRASRVSSFAAASAKGNGINTMPCGERVVTMDYNLSKGDKGYTLTYDWGEEGFYNIYVIEKYVRNDTLFVLIAKAERLHHKCRAGHKGIRKKLPPKTFPQKRVSHIQKQKPKPITSYQKIFAINTQNKSMMAWKL